MCLQEISLTALVLDWAADSVLIDRLASFNLEITLLHDASSVVADTVAKLTWCAGVTGNLQPRKNVLYTYPEMKLV